MRLGTFTKVFCVTAIIGFLSQINSPQASSSSQEDDLVHGHDIIVHEDRASANQDSDEKLVTTISHQKGAKNAVITFHDTVTGRSVQFAEECNLHSLFRSGAVGNGGAMLGVDQEKRAAIAHLISEYSQDPKNSNRLAETTYRSALDAAVVVCDLGTTFKQHVGRVEWLKANNLTIGEEPYMVQSRDPSTGLLTNATIHFTKVAVQPANGSDVQLAGGPYVRPVNAGLFSPRF